jgi:hypothetical protein
MARSATVAMREPVKKASDRHPAHPARLQTGLIPKVAAKTHPTKHAIIAMALWARLSPPNTPERVTR